MNVVSETFPKFLTIISLESEHLFCSDISKKKNHCQQKINKFFKKIYLFTNKKFMWINVTNAFSVDKKWITIIVRM